MQKSLKIVKNLPFYKIILDLTQKGGYGILPNNGPAEFYFGISC
jgi:hypothetical protein